MSRSARQRLFYIVHLDRARILLLALGFVSCLVFAFATGLRVGQDRFASNPAPRDSAGPRNSSDAPAFLEPVPGDETDGPGDSSPDDGDGTLPALENEGVPTSDPSDRQRSGPGDANGERSRPERENQDDTRDLLPDEIGGGEADAPGLDAYALLPGGRYLRSALTGSPLPADPAAERRASEERLAAMRRAAEKLETEQNFSQPTEAALEARRELEERERREAEAVRRQREERAEAERRAQQRAAEARRARATRPAPRQARPTAETDTERRAPDPRTSLAAAQQAATGEDAEPEGEARRATVATSTGRPARYSLQVGAFRSPGAAERMLSDLRAAGFEPYLLRTGDRRLVRVGQAARLSDLSDLERRLRARNYAPMRVER